MSSDENSDYRDPTGLEWIHEAVHRLNEEWECVTDHFAALFDEDTTEENVIEHAYKLMKHLPAFSGHIASLSAEVFQHLCPMHVQQQLAVEMVEEMTGQPWEIVHADGIGFLLHQQDVKVPDEVPKEWTEGDGE